MIVQSTVTGSRMTLNFLISTENLLVQVNPGAQKGAQDLLPFDEAYRRAFARRAKHSNAGTTGFQGLTGVGCKPTVINGDSSIVPSCP